MGSTALQQDSLSQAKHKSVHRDPENGCWDFLALVVCSSSQCVYIEKKNPFSVLLQHLSDWPFAKPSPLELPETQL